MITSRFNRLKLLLLLVIVTMTLNYTSLSWAIATQASPASAASVDTDKSLSDIKDANIKMGQLNSAEIKDKRAAMQQQQSFYRQKMYSKHMQPIREEQLARLEQREKKWQHDKSTRPKLQTPERTQSEALPQERLSHRQGIRELFKNRSNPGFYRAGDQAKKSATHPMTQIEAEKSRGESFGYGRQQNEWVSQRSQNHHQRIGQVQRGMHPKAYQRDSGLQNQEETPIKPVRQRGHQTMGPNGQQRLSSFRQQQTEREKEVGQQFVDSSDDLISAENSEE